MIYVKNLITKKHKKTIQDNLKRTNNGLKQGKIHTEFFY